MSKTMIKTADVMNSSGSARSAAGIAANVSGSIASVSGRTDWQIKGRYGISWRLSNAQKRVAQIQREISAIYQTAESGVSKYIATENQIINYGRSVGILHNKPAVSENRVAYEACFATVEVGEVEEKQVEEKKSGNEALDFAFDVIGQAGIVGNAISGIGGMVTGFQDGTSNGEKYKALLGGADKFVSTVGDLAEEAYKDSKDMNLKKVLFGNWEKGGALDDLIDLGVDATSSKGKIFVKALDNEKNSFIFKKADKVGQATKVGENIKVGAKWAGVALSAVSNGIDNYEEFGSTNNVRFWGETIGETIADVAIGAVATAAATALIGASAPAVAVGALAVGITWAADSITKWATKKFMGEEKDLAEFASDLVLDAGEAIIDKGKEAVNNMKNTFNNIGVKWRECFG